MPASSGLNCATAFFSSSSAYSFICLYFTFHAPAVCRPMPGGVEPTVAAQRCDRLGDAPTSGSATAAAAIASGLIDELAAVGELRREDVSSDADAAPCCDDVKGAAHVNHMPGKPRSSSPPDVSAVLYRASYAFLYASFALLYARWNAELYWSKDWRKPEVKGSSVQSLDAQAVARAARRLQHILAVA
eukprot:CAMPEP_0183347746 /NCGR_PEP_ID=MMETSP0164_2-20130417/12471_1 /TAXON_ID=221442 /ORGANISM="Coccolithus pelagicus ssp braarudi, Strain PLY182g" /LENGTH=187 /DNA_ID=CAMNT_0025519223 /DNA_START=347 /DNA_END=910 /DNA_ORIENTATION=+